MSVMVAGVSRQDWAQVARLVRTRREALNLTQHDAVVASEGSISLATWRNIETGANTSYRSSSLIAVCRALGWTPDSIERILGGDDPVEVAAANEDLSLHERMTRVEAALEGFSAAIDGLADEVRAQRDSSARSPAT